MSKAADSAIGYYSTRAEELVAGTDEAVRGEVDHIIAVRSDEIVEDFEKLIEAASSRTEVVAAIFDAWGLTTYDWVAVDAIKTVARGLRSGELPKSEGQKFIDGLGAL